MPNTPSGGAIPPTWVVHVDVTRDAIGWSGLPSDPAYGCIDPPPFGKQCTLPRAAAIAACMAMEGCIAITCPDPRESHIGTRGITGPICQLRSSRVANEKSHGMCRPGGCINIGLSRLRRPAFLHNWQVGLPANVSFSNPQLAFLHGEERLRTELLPAGLGRYWPLRRDDGRATGGGAGMLFAVDAVPLVNAATTGARPHHYRRRDLWAAERGGGPALERRTSPSWRESTTAHAHGAASVEVEAEGGRGRARGFFARGGRGGPRRLARRGRGRGD